MVYAPKSPHKFLLWWAIKGPIKTLKICLFILSVANNELSFITNVRLLFVPLFNIRTIPGRIMSFFARIFMIIFGMFFMIGLLILCLLAPILWLATPIIIGYFSIEWLILFIIVFYLLWTIINLDKPAKKIAQISESQDPKKAFRPSTRNYIFKVLKGSGIKILKHKKIKYLLRKSEIEISQIQKILSRSKPELKKLVENSFNIAKENKSRYVELEHLFISLLKNTPGIERALDTINSSLKTIKHTAFWLVEEREYFSKIYIWQDDHKTPPLGGIGRGMLGRVTPKLDAVSTDITKAAQKGRVENIIGREEEIKKISELLDGEKNDILIIGEPGSGKTSILKGIARRIIYGTEYKTLNNKRVVSLNMGNLISGTDSTSEIAGKLSDVFGEVEGSGDIILFVDEMHNLVTGLGEKGGEESTIFSMLEDHLNNEGTRFIGATSISNYRKYIEPNETISRLFHIVKIDENSKEETMEILKYVARQTEREHKIIVTYPALVKCVELSEKLIHERVLPDKAIDILNRTATSVKNSTRYLTSDDIAKEISELTDIPVTTITEDEAQKLLGISKRMKKRVIGQDHAIEQISEALQRARTGMRNEKKPIASFLFVGTTGVGKTETAKTLAKSYFGSEKNMIRLDMSEYQQIDSINRLIGSPDGSINGVLTDKVRTKPFSLVLIDEIEKAHPNILLMFLQVFDEGRLTDTKGNLADFTNTIIISTSNVGTKSIQKILEAGGTHEQMRESAMNDIRNNFAPELLNRFTEIIVFNPLSMDNLRKITRLLLKKIIHTADEKNIKISFKPELIDKLISKGYNPQWGARPLAREIENSVESYIALKLLKKEIKSGDSITLGLEVFDNNSN